jgi:hypothetical protein
MAMTPGDIRRQLESKLQGKSLETAQIHVLIEIAVQLAEANALARFELGLDDEKGTP